MPRDALDLARRARENLPGLDDDAMVEVRIKAPTEANARYKRLECSCTRLST